MALKKRNTKVSTKVVKTSKVKTLAKKISSGKTKTITKFKKGLTKFTKKTPIKKDSVYLNSDKLFEYVQTRAYHVWEEMGKPAGQEHDIWQKAEADIKKQFKTK